MKNVDVYKPLLEKILHKIANDKYETLREYVIVIEIITLLKEFIEDVSK